jgi:hypothetical protein
MLNTMIKEHDRVVLKTAVPAEGLEAGDVGTVVHVYADVRAFGLAWEDCEQLVARLGRGIQRPTIGGRLARFGLS